MKIISKLLYLCVLSALVYTTYYISLSFGFWKDDWMSVWTGIYHPEWLLRGWMHPIATIEFIILPKLFGDQVMYWQAFGLLLRLIAALSVSRFSATFFRSRKAGIVSGLFTASTVIGMDAGTWASAYASLFVITFLSWGLHFWILFLRNGSRVLLAASLSILLCGLISDIYRTWWIVPVIHYLTLISAEKQMVHRAVRVLSIMYWCVILLLPVAFYMSWSIIADMQIVHFVASHISNPAYLISRASYAGNFFNSLFIMLFGWFIPIAENGTLSEHSRIFSYLGLGITLSAVLFVRFSRIKVKTRQLLSFFILWILGFYISTWIFQPRLVYGVSHRFQAISGVGLLLFFTWMIAAVKNKYLAFASLIFIVVCNMSAVHNILKGQSTYRSDKIIEYYWETVDRAVSRDGQSSMMYFVGDGQWYYNVFTLSGPTPLAIRRKYTRLSQFPVMVYDMNGVAYFACDTKPQYPLIGMTVMLPENVKKDHIFSWNVQDTSLIPVHEQVREQIHCDSMVE